MTMIAHLPGRAVLEVTGADRVQFLQGLVSNDVAAAAPGRAVWAALLTPQGKWLADFYIVAEPARLLLDVESAQAEMLRQKFTRYRLRANVAIEPAPLMGSCGLERPRPARERPGRCLPRPRLPEAGWRLISADPLPTTATRRALRRPPSRPRVARRLPRPGAEKTTLLEAGFDELHGISWTKGCYMGQELTARTKYRGLLKRRLVPVHVDGPLPELGGAVFRNGVEVGTMRSGRDAAGLAVLRLDALAGPLTSGHSGLTVTRPAWMAVDEAV